MNGRFLTKKCCQNRERELLGPRGDLIVVDQATGAKLCFSVYQLG